MDSIRTLLKSPLGVDLQMYASSRWPQRLVNFRHHNSRIFKDMKLNVPLVVLESHSAS